MQIIFETIFTDLKWTIHGSINRSTENFRASTLSDTKNKLSWTPKGPSSASSGDFHVKFSDSGRSEVHYNLFISSNSDNL